jgi:hypothetical protein
MSFLCKRGALAWFRTGKSGPESRIFFKASGLNAKINFTFTGRPLIMTLNLPLLASALFASATKPVFAWVYYLLYANNHKSL